MFFFNKRMRLGFVLMLMVSACASNIGVDAHANVETFTEVGGTEMFNAAKHRRQRRMRSLATGGCSVTGCGDHGTCVPGVGCVCDQDTTKGFWAVGADGTCSDCSNGYAGSSCMIECQGGSCNQCNQNGVCFSGVQGDGTCNCYKDREHGFWSGASCSTCSSGYFGQKCLNFCPGVETGTPCANRGQCQTDSAGNGACVCIAGYGPDSGCAFCDAAHYSVGCALTCPGFVAEGMYAGSACSGHGKCFNGTSGNGTCVCDSSWGLEDCSARCPNNCSGHGLCDDSAAGTATCTCHPFYAPPDCFSCIANRTGCNCELPCPMKNNKVCSNNGACDTYIHCNISNATDSSNVTATSNATDVAFVPFCRCAPGYTGDVCEIGCPGSPPCSGHGACIAVVNGSGFTTYSCSCDQNNITGYWDGPTCSYCSLSHNNSYQCRTPCPINNREICSGNGTCAEGVCYCIRRDSASGLDFCGTACETSSQPPTSDTGSCTGCGCYFCVNQYTYGQTCGGTCPPGAVAIANGAAVCNGNGVCSEGKTNPGTCDCFFGFAGTSCASSCPFSSLNGLRCSGFSRGVCTCQSSDEPCVPVCACRDGFAGLACEISCPIVDGQTCSGHGTCNPRNGTCQCDVSFTGYSCSVPCGCNTQNGVCDPEACKWNSASDVCTTCLCSGNFTGICNLCKPRTQGKSCEGECVHGTTSNTTKECICAPNWSTASCNVPCLRGKNGLICSGNGTCAAGNRQSGLCACNQSLYGATCETFCTPKMCKQTFGMQNAQCNQITGQCECQNDASGYWDGQFCNLCAYGYWGTTCTDQCDCSGHGSCDAIACYCNSDPINGFFVGATCDSCQPGYIGANCTIEDVAITRLNGRQLTGLSGAFLLQANMTMNNPSLHSPVAPVAVADEVNNAYQLFVGGRSVAQLDVSESNMMFQRSTSNASVFASVNCTSPPDVAHMFVDNQYYYFLMQPMNVLDDGCDLPIRLVIVFRGSFSLVRIAPLNVAYTLSNSSVQSTGTFFTFNYTVRVVAATSVSDNGFSVDAIKPRLAFLVAQTYLDGTTGFLTPYPNGWLVHVLADDLGQSRAIVCRQLDQTFTANDVAMSAFTADSNSVVAVAGFYPSTWDVQAFYVVTGGAFTNAFDTYSPSIKARAPCWTKLSGLPDTDTCSYCQRAERLHWINNDLVFAVSSNLPDSDTVIVWARRIQDMQEGSTVFAQVSSVPTSSCLFQNLTFVNGIQLMSNASVRSLPSCQTVICSEALFHIQITQTGTPTSQATAIAFDVVSNVTYVALRVNAGNSASVLAKCSVSPEKFVVYGLLTLSYVTNVVGRSKPEVFLSMGIARRARILYAPVSGVQSLSVVSILLYEIKSIAPNIADQRNNTLITITGSGFARVPKDPSQSFFYDLNCAFGGTFTPATLISATEMRCYAPTESETSSAQTCGQQVLEVTMYNQSYFTNNQVQIQRAQSAKLISVNPVRGAVRSRTPQVINITGTGFQNSTFSRCKFFSNSTLPTETLYSPVTLITPNLVQCIQPNATEASYDTALLDLSVDGQLYTIDGPLVYEIVGDAAAIANEPSTLTVTADVITNFTFTTFVVDERKHKLESLDTENRTFYLLFNVTYDSDCSSTAWRPRINCIPNFYLANATYPNATLSGDSRYSSTPCFNATLNGVTSPLAPWLPSDDATAEFPIGYAGNRLTFDSSKVFALYAQNGQVTFDNLFFISPRAGNISLTVIIPGTSWSTTTTVVVTAGAPFALAIFNIADFESYDAKSLQSPNCSTTLKTKFLIGKSTISIELVIVDRMANVVTPSVNQYLLTASTYYIQDFDYKRVDNLGSPPAPTQRDNKFIYSEITLPFIHGVAHFIVFNATDRTTNIIYSTTSPPIRTTPCGDEEYKVPLTSKCAGCPGAGASCDGSELIVVKPGYWRANGSTTKLYLCQGGPTICLGSFGAYNESYCKPGHQGPLCANCIDGYGKSGQDCVPCQSFGVSASIVMVVLLVVFIVLIVWTIATLRNAETTDSSVIMRTVVNHMQATGELGAFSSQYGPFLQSFMSGQGAAGGSVSLNGVQSFDCLLRTSGQNYYAIFAGYMCLPILALVLALVVFAVVRALKLVPIITPELRKEIDEDIKNFGANARTAIIKESYPMFMVVVTTNCVIMFTLYQTIITQCANALQCNSYVFSEALDGSSVSKSFLQVDMSIACSGSTSPLTTPALIFAALYGLGIPLAFTLGYMFVNDTVNMPQLTKLMFMFLTGGYKEQFFFWQNLIMIRKLVLVLMIVFLKSEQELLNYCVMWVMSVSLVLQVWLQPAEKDEHNLVESISLAVIVITLNLGLLYFWSLSSFASEALTMALLLITVGVLLCFAYFMAMALKSEVKEIIEVVSDLIDSLMREKDDKKKRRRRLKLAAVMDADNQDDLPQLTQPRHGSRFGGHYSEGPTEADFGEYSSAENSEDDGDEPRQARYKRRGPTGSYSPSVASNSQLSPKRDVDPQVAAWGFSNVSETPTVAPQVRGWRPVNQQQGPEELNNYDATKARGNAAASLYLDSYYDDL